MGFASRLGDRPVFRPAIEGWRGRASVEDRAAATMPLVIEKHIDERIAHLAQTGQWASVIPIRDHAAARAQKTIEVPCEPHAQSLHPCRQAPAIVGLDEHVEVIGLNAEVHDANESLLGSANLRPDTRK
jgi:hypothetical protein